MKNAGKLFLLISILLLATGCSELLKDPKAKSSRIKFQENVEINYGDKNIDTTKFVTGYDTSTISDENRDHENLIIEIDNYVINCPSFNADKTGKHTLVYKLDEYTYNLEVLVKDKEKPVIKYNKDYEYYTDEKISLKKLFDVSDNMTKKSKIKTKIKGKVDNKKAGDYKITFSATDEANNTSKVSATIHIYEKPMLNINKKSFSLKIGQTEQIKVSVKGKDLKPTFTSGNIQIVSVDENGRIKGVSGGKTTIKITANGLEESVTVNVISNSTSSSSNSSSSNNQTSKPNSSNSSGSSPVSKPKGNPSSYNRYFAGNSIDNYNKAYDYAESIINSGKANGYSVMPDGNGFNVTFQ